MGGIKGLFKGGDMAKNVNPQQMAQLNQQVRLLDLGKLICWLRNLGGRQEFDCSCKVINSTNAQRIWQCIGNFFI